MRKHHHSLPHSFKAKTHPPEYRLHKYWARKPHNVIAAFLKVLVPLDGHILDPFCGSGVVLAEARAQGLHATGIDLNPAAILISELSVAPPDPADFENALEALLDWSSSTLEPLYRLPDGQTVRYCVHSTIITCPDCNHRVSAWDIREQGRKRRCPICQAKLRFNLATLVDTEVVKVVTTDGLVHIDSAILAHQHTAAYQAGLGGPISAQEMPMLPNPRILSRQNTIIADLFTPRNYEAGFTLFAGIRSTTADGFGAIPGNITANVHDLPNETRALSVMLTASVAGFSRLIAYRDGLRNGGPAWSIPGFWVAPVHVEHNPLPLLASWAKRYRRGIAKLWDRLQDRPPATLYQGAAQEICKTAAKKNQSYDLIFLDPPYGDSVPYLEYSALWNAFLASEPDYDYEVVVSNRKAKQAGWQEYKTRLHDTLQQCKHILKPEGVILVTFNNLDGRAWGALLNALYDAELICDSAHYIAPAVNSARYHLTPDGGYKGDFWCVFRRGARLATCQAQWIDVWETTISLEDTREKRWQSALRATLESNLPAEAVLLLRECL